MASVSGIVRQAFVFACLVVSFTLLATFGPTNFDLFLALLFTHIHLISAGGDCGPVSRQFGRRFADNDVVDVFFHPSSSVFYDRGFWRLPCVRLLRCVASSCLFLFNNVASADFR